MFELLLKKGAKPQAAWLHLAIKHRAVEAIKLLLDNSLDVDARDEEGRTALLSLAAEGHQNKLIKLFLDYGADINAKDEEGRTALILATGQIGLTKLLLEHGPDVSVKDDEGRTALSLAISNGEKRVEKLLRDHGSLGPSSCFSATCTIYSLP